MKSFAIAWVLLFSVMTFVFCNAHITVSTVDELLSLAETLPVHAKDIRFEEDGKTVRALAELWDKKFPYIAFTAGYESTDRCDEALGALTVHFENQNHTDFAAALSEFRDGLKRLRILEGFHIEGIF